VDGESNALAEPVAYEGGDTIYALDRDVEPILLREVESWAEPLLLIVEGMGHDGRLRIGKADREPAYRLIIDPIDGTRGLMYDKRSAWFLAAIARDRGEATTLNDSFASAMVELPTSKQAWADSFVAIAGHGVQARRLHLDEQKERPLEIRPSTAETLKDGFAQVSNFFPGTKQLASELMETIVEATLGQVRIGSADVFEDQYISSGGQMVELMLGHDRFCCDLRPLFYRIRERQGAGAARGVECHPYDLGGVLVAKQAGIILTDGFDNPLDCPLNVHQGIHWCGYANETLRRQIAPVIRDWLVHHGITGP